MGQHWKEKQRDEMTERDWRIFREDYNIGYKGAMDKCTLPIRNWSEANLPSDLVKVTSFLLPNLEKRYLSYPVHLDDWYDSQAPRPYWVSRSDCIHADQK